MSERSRSPNVEPMNYNVAKILDAHTHLTGQESPEQCRKGSQKISGPTRPLFQGERSPTRSAGSQARRELSRLLSIGPFPPTRGPTTPPTSYHFLRASCYIFRTILCPNPASSTIWGGLSPDAPVPVRLELGAQRGGVDLAQRPVGAALWREEVRLGVVKEDKGNGPDLDHAVLVQRDLGEDAGRGLLRPGLVEEEVAHTVEDRVALVHFDAFGPVGVPADDHIRARVHGRVRPVHLPRLRRGEVLLAPVRHYDHEVHLVAQPLYVLRHDLLLDGRRAGGGLRGPGPVVGGDAQVGEDAYLRLPDLEDHWLARLG